jgi:serine/threonine protein kinase
MPRTSDRNLLFGMLALQMDFVARSALIECMQAWLLDKNKTLGELLCERGNLTPENRSLLEPLVDAHIQQHGGEARHSLAALSSDGGIVEGLAMVEDAEVQASLSLLPQSEPFVPPAAGFPSTAAQPDEEPFDEQDAADALSIGEGPIIASGRIAPQPVSSLGNAPNVAETLGEATIDEAHAAETSSKATIGDPHAPKSRFRIIRPHAEGGLGRVFVAVDSELNREVAFKDIKPEYSQNKDAQSRFVVEAEVTGGVEHPGIVPVYGLGHFDDGRPFYAMRFIRGQSLQAAVLAFHNATSCQVPPPAGAPANVAASRPTEILPYSSNREFRDLINRLIDVCNAMHYAHDRKVLHRDLKPGNIMLGKYGETLIVDWGLAKTAGCDKPSECSPDGELPLVPASGSQSAPTQMGNAIGTPAYMSPEQASGHLDQLGPASDVYSLGATLYEILAGQHPLKGLRLADLLKRVQEGTIPQARRLNSNIPAALNAICRKAMSLSPTDRYSSAALLADDLEAWLAEEPVSAYREPVLVRFRRWTRQHPVITSTAITATLLFIPALMTLVISSFNARVRSFTAEESAMYQGLIASATLENVVGEMDSVLLKHDCPIDVRREINIFLVRRLEKQAFEQVSESSINRVSIDRLMTTGGMIRSVTDRLIGDRSDGLGVNVVFIEPSQLEATSLLYKRVIEIAEALSTTEQPIGWANSVIATSYRRLAEISLQTRQLRAAGQFCRKAISIYSDLISDTPDNFFLQELAYTYEILGAAKLLDESHSPLLLDPEKQLVKRAKNAIDAYLEARVLYERLIRDGFTDFGAQQRLTHTIQMIGLASDRIGGLED